VWKCNEFFLKQFFIKKIKYEFLPKTKYFIVDLHRDYVRRWGRKIKMRFKIIEIIYHLHYEGNVLAVTLNDAHGISGFHGTQF